MVAVLLPARIQVMEKAAHPRLMANRHKARVAVGEWGLPRNR